MTGSNIFMIYANAAGTNVTLSPRLGTGNSQPSADTAAEVTLLSGSGISNNMMVANVRCMTDNSFRKGLDTDFDQARTATVGQEDQ
jgi:hypothetical protein